MTEVIERVEDVDIVPCGEGMSVRLLRFDRPRNAFERSETGDWLNFHFQLRGPNRQANQPGFAVTISCRPHSLSDRFGFGPESLPVVTRVYSDEGEYCWFTEAGKLTPEMAMSLRALETMPFVGRMRRAYVEARAVELLCELWSQMDRCQVGLAAPIDERTLVKVERTRASIDEGFAEPLVMRKLARDVGTNATKLSHAFRTLYGMTIFEYVRSRRMEEAQRLLRSGGLSVTEIAFEVGYEYPCNFSVAYKRHFGVTPRQERAAMRMDMAHHLACAQERGFAHLL